MIHACIIHFLRILTCLKLFCENDFCHNNVVHINYISALEVSAKKNPQKLLRNMDDYIESKKSSVNLDNMDIGQASFLSVCDSDAGQY